MFRDILSSSRHPADVFVSDFIDDELPLPSFPDVFGFSVAPSSHSKSHKRRLSGSDGIDAKNSAKRYKSDDLEKNKVHHDSGRWTSEEHKLFLEGVMLYGKDWKKMQPLIKTRSLVQIRTHAQKVFKKIGLKRLNSTGLSNGEKQPQGYRTTAVTAPGQNEVSEESVELPQTECVKAMVQPKEPVDKITSVDEREPKINISQNSSHFSNSVANAFRGDDMEVTDEEFNLVVQHLKNLGEIRAEDLSDEGEDISLHELDERSSEPIDKASYHNNFSPENFRNVNTFNNRSDYNDQETIERPSILQHDSVDEQEKLNGKGQLPSQSFASEEDLQNHHLMQTLRQYLMPDNENGEGLSSSEYF